VPTATLSNESESQSRDVKLWILEILNPYFDKSDRMDRMTGTRRLYRCPFTDLETR